MKTILVPTDFSSNADHALQYAIELNKKLQAKIVLFHSVFVAMFATDVPGNIPDDEELQKDAMSLLEQIKNRVSRENQEMDFSLKTSNGFAEDEIAEEEKRSKADFVIMGTHGASSLAGLLVGSNTAAVIDKSVCPVIAVPEKAILSLPKKIVYATNYGEEDFQNIISVIDFARLFEAEVNILHISDGKMDKAYEFASIETLADKVRSESKYPNVEFKLIESDDVYKALNNYLDEINADMVAISRHRHHFKLFSRSLTKKMAYHTHIPLIAFHT